MRLQRPAIPSPAVAAPAKITAAATVSKLIRNANVLAAVKIPRGFVRLEPSAFKQAGFNSMFFEFQGKRDTGDSTANNADFGVDNRSLSKAACIDKHAF